MELFKNTKNSIYNPEYYNSLLSEPFSFSLKYFLLFTLIFSAIFSLIYSVRIIPPLRNFLNEKSMEILQRYPEGLEITIKKGKVLTNAEEPYFVKFPKREMPGSTGPKNFLVIDTRSDFSLEKFYSYSTAILLTRDSVVSQEKGKVTINQLENFPDFTVNKTVVSSFINKITPYFNLVIPIVMFGMLFGIYTAVSFRLVYLVVAALLIWVIGKIKKVNLNYSKSYQIGLHLMTLPIVVTFSLNLVSPQTSIPFLFTILTVVVAFINLDNVPAGSSAEKPSQEEPPAS